MKKDQFLKVYVAQYVAIKMAALNRNEVQNADLHLNMARRAAIEASQIWDILFI